MLSSCTHCGATYQLPDKMLGKKARCKACEKLFVLTPDEPEASLDEVEPPRRGGSTARLTPVEQQQIDDDPLDALADAAVESGSHMPPARPAAASSTRTLQPIDEDDETPRGRTRMASGAMSSMVMGIIAAGLAVGGTVCIIIAMVNPDDKDLLVITGVLGLIQMAASAVLSMIGVSSASSANRAIRRARHPLTGKDQALVGMITGSGALVLILIMALVAGIWLSKRGGITFEETIQAGEDD